MAHIILTAKVKDAATWETNFLTHADLFRSQTVKSPIHYTVTGDNQVMICVEPENQATFMEIFHSQATVDAMIQDGVDPSSAKAVVLDKEFPI